MSVITHKGKRIIYGNLTGLSEAEILKFLDESKEILIKEKTNLLILDITDTTTTKAIKQKSQQVIVEVEKEVGKIYSSLIGLRLSQQIIANIIKSDQYFASNLENAKEWLIKKAGS